MKKILSHGVAKVQEYLAQPGPKVKQFVPKRSQRSPVKRYRYDDLTIFHLLEISQWVAQHSKL